MTGKDYQSIDELIKHLQNGGIAISGENQKRQLINTGYFHGYKGYRFFQDPKCRLPFVSYGEIHSTIEYDTELKTLLYAKMMYIETALKSIAMNTIMEKIGSSSIRDLYDRAVSSYRNSPSGTPENAKKQMQNNKLALQGSVQNAIAAAYRKDNPKITHFYNHARYGEVPLWALIEIMTMGDFGKLISCLTIDMRREISREIGLNLSCDTNCELVYRYIYALKDLRNAIAHNDVVYDARFRRFEPSRAMKQCLMLEMDMPYINFKTIGDYLILICYYLRLLKVSQHEITEMIGRFEEITRNYMRSVNEKVTDIVIHPDTMQRVSKMKQMFRK